MKSANFSNQLEMEMQAKIGKSVGGGSGVLHLPFRRFDKELPTMYRENEGNAGFDLFARLEETLVIQPGEVVTIPLNLAVKMPKFVVGLLFQRSSTYKKWGIKLTNNVGVIDSLFSGSEDEWGAQFKNETNEPVTIRRGDKICQAVFLPLVPVVPYEVEELDSINRGGFGTSPDNA